MKSTNQGDYAHENSDGGWNESFRQSKCIIVIASIESFCFFRRVMIICNLQDLDYL